MTDQVSGSSLPQTRDLRQQQHQQQQQPQQQQEQDQHRRHTHPHSRKVPSSHQHNSKRNHIHSHNHQHLHHVRSQQNSEPHQPDTSDDNADSSSDIVVVVETISVLQVTDLTGATIIQTLPHDYPTTPVITDSRSESTVASSTKKPSSTDTDLPDTTSTSSASNDGNGVAHPSSSSSSTIEDPTVTPSGSSMPTSFPTLSYAPITATPLSAAPVFPSLSGHSNSTFSSSSSAFGNSSASSHSFTTSSEDGFSILGGATGTRSKTSSHPSSSVFTQSVFGTSTSKSSPSVTYTYLTATAKPEATTTGGGDGIGSPADTGSGDGSVPTSGAGSGSGSGSGNTSAGTIAGSVVGAISGLAIILLLAATFLRWKKRQSSMKLIQESGNDRGYGAMITGGSGGSGGGGGGMSEHRRPIPFAIPAALANLTSQRFSRSTVSSNGGERGFTKVSGRKLPPVIQFGGDGYTDPRATMMSDQSIDYRASQNFFGEAPLSRLAVGAPMLQETSTPVFHASPARTAIATPGPFSDPFSDDNRVESPTMPPDPVGRSHLPQDRSTRSHGSFSRFTEDL